MKMGMLSSPIMLLVGVVGVFLLYKFRKAISKNIAVVVLGGLALLLAFGGVGSLQAVDKATTTETTGEIYLTVDEGVANITKTEDSIPTDKQSLTFYSADANIIDGEEYDTNVTIYRTKISEDANIRVTCTAPDKEISGITADSLVEKTNGIVDLDIRRAGVDTGDNGVHVGENTVYYDVPLAEGTGSDVITISFDQEETWHDGMTDLQTDYTVSCDAGGVPFHIKVYANS